MRKTHLLVAGLLIAPPAHAGLLDEIGEIVAEPAQADTSLALEQVVANVQRAYEATEDFTASFTQAYTNVALGDTDRSAGTVHFLRPGRMRWDYTEPRQRFFISDGEQLWIYEPEQAQYYTQPLDDSDLPTALRFLFGEGDLARDFEVSFADEVVPGAIVLDLVPRAGEAHYRSLRFEVNPTTWEVDVATIVDPVGNTNTFRFEGRETNVGYLPGDFHFEPPRGARRIESPE
jgi:outer membrane lipoprotein carrier protein